MINFLLNSLFSVRVNFELPILGYYILITLILTILLMVIRIALDGKYKQWKVKSKIRKVKMTLFEINKALIQQRYPRHTRKQITRELISFSRAAATMLNKIGKL